MPSPRNAIKSSPPDDNGDSHPFRPSGDLNDPLQIGITIVGTTALFGGAGWWLDSKLHTFPILMAIGASLGLFGIIYLTYLRLQQSGKRTNSTSGQSKPSSEGKK